MPATTAVARRVAVTTALALAAGLVVAGTGAERPAAAAAGDPVIAAAGDIACDPTIGTPDPDGADPRYCQQRATSDLLVGQPLAAVLALGDLQYEDGAAAKFAAAYDPTWGRVRSLTRPAVGNHEYGSTGAAPYFDYFGAAAGPRGLGYYSYDVGSWHLIALNSNCAEVSCAAGSAQERWLREDLAANPADCTLAYWHHPRFASGSSPRSSVRPLWQALQDAGADVVLVGHAHNYERFAPQDVDGRATPDGIRQIVVGTGGKNFHSHGTVAANSEVRNASAYGVLLMTLRDGAYDWRFAGTKGESVDSGTTSCTRQAPASPAPSAPAPSAPAGCAAPLAVRLDGTPLQAGGSEPVEVHGPPGTDVQLHAYSRPSTTFRLVREGRTDAAGVARFDLRPPTNTRLYAQQPGCPAGASVVLDVRTTLSIAAQRLGVRDYAFSGDSLPARPGGLIVSLYRVTDAGEQVLTAQARADASDGEWSLRRVFTGSGRFGFVVRTGQDLQNAPGSSRVRSTLVY